MPAKSPQPRGKHPHQSKKSKSIQRRGSLSTSPAAPEKPAHVVEEPAAAAAPVPTGTPSRQHAMSYPYIYGEIRRIALMAAIMIIILIILAIVIP